MSEIILHGELVTPMGLVDALDIVEEELGADLRQYLESYLMDEGFQDQWSDNDLLVDQKEHFLSVLDNIDVKVAALEQLLSQKRMNKKKLTEKTEDIRGIIYREVSRG